jgi:hypothetical protein
MRQQSQGVPGQLLFPHSSDNVVTKFGLSDYLSFWSTVRAVTVILVRPSDTGSVVANFQLRRDDRADDHRRSVFIAGTPLASDSESVKRNGRKLAGRAVVASSLQCMAGWK